MRKLLFILILAGTACCAFAQGIVDFDNLPWMLNGDTNNGGAIINSNAFVVTDGSPGENRSAWFRDPLYVGAFQAAFTYQDVGGGGADGIAFVLQYDSRGTNALGYSAGGLGYCDIAQSVAVLFNIYNGAQGGAGIMIATNGIGAEDLSGASSGNAYQSTAPVNLASGNPINVSLHYDGAILQVTLSDPVANSAFQTSIPINIPSFVNSNVAWVGITGSEGDGTANQIVSNFTFAPIPTLRVNRGSGSNFTYSWPTSISGYMLQSTPSLTNSVWSNVTGQFNYTNGLTQVSVSSNTNSQFYRLVTARRPRVGGLTAKGIIALAGFSFVDSFDSSNPLYSTGGQYDFNKHRDHAGVLTDSGATNAIHLGTGVIYGYAITGSTGTVTGGTIGDIAWNSSHGGYEPGHVNNDASVQFVDLAAPFVYGTGITPTGASYTYNGTNYTYALGTGNYNMGGFVNIPGGKSMVVTGNPTVLYFNGSWFTVSGSGFIYIAPGASLQLYLNGNGTFSGGGIVNGGGVATNLCVYGMTNCMQITYSASARFTGVLYAPEAAVTYSGAADFSGSATASTIFVSGGANIHFDESLLHAR